MRLFDAELVRRIQAANIAQIVVVVQQQLPDRSMLGKALRALKNGRLARALVFRAVVWIERLLLAYNRPEIDGLFKSIPVDQVCNAKRLWVKPLVSPSGLVHRFTPQDVAAIRSRKLDVLLRMGSGILRGDILNATPNGIISFHHGDSRTNRGQPPGFWEVFEKRDHSGFIIQRLTEELDAGEILTRGEVATKFTYLLNQYHLYKCSITSMIDLLVRMQRREIEAQTGDAGAISWYSNALYTTPSIAESLSYLTVLACRFLAKALAAVLFRRGVWELRLLKSDWWNLSLSKAKKLTPPPGKFWADPFIVRRSDERVIFFEEYDFTRGKAHIAALVNTQDGAFSYAGPVIRTPYHLSFPYVFRYQGDYYMCPESFEAGAIQLWRCTAWPLDWRYYKTLLAEISAADTMIFERHGRWWLFTNIDRDGVGDHCRELHIYHADSPLSERWTPLPRNPVITGASRARNAGLLFRDGRAYRLAQSQGFDLYGRSIKLFEMTTLSEQHYEESLVGELVPNRGLDAIAIHHLSCCDGMVAFDAYRPRNLWSRFLRPRISELRPRLAKQLHLGDTL